MIYSYLEINAFNIKLFQLLSWVSRLQFHHSAVKLLFFCLEMWHLPSLAFSSTGLRTFITTVSANSIFNFRFSFSYSVSAQQLILSSPFPFWRRTFWISDSVSNFFSLPTKTCYISFSIYLSRAQFSSILGPFTQEKFPSIKCRRCCLKVKINYFIMWKDKWLGLLKELKKMEEYKKEFN